MADTPYTVTKPWGDKETRWGFHYAHDSNWPDRQRRIEQWCQSYCDGPWAYGTYGCCVYFENKRDASLFRMMHL